jgi:hypothetical protein
MQQCLRLGESREERREDGKWVTRLVFRSSFPVLLNKFALTIVFDRPFDESRPFVTGSGMVVAGELKTLEGEKSSRIFKCEGTDLLANNDLVVEFVSTKQLRLVFSESSPTPES